MTRAALTTVVALLLLAVAGTFAATGWYFDRETFDEGVVVSTMRSTVLGEDREVIVHPPESYLSHPDRRYPVIYVLDGSNQDIHTARSAALMARIGLMPEVLVVGVPNVSGPGRQRDYTPPFMVQDIDDAKSPMGRGDRFLEFMRTELIPDIERNYRADSTRMLLGHSRGGLLVAYSLMATPELFQARFAHSHGWRGSWEEWRMGHPRGPSGLLPELDGQPVAPLPNPWAGTSV